MKFDGLEMPATVAAVGALGDQLCGERIITFSDNNAAAGSIIKASSKVAVVLAIIERFWRTVARMSAACWIKRATIASWAAG